MTHTDTWPRIVHDYTQVPRADVDAAIAEAAEKRAAEAERMEKVNRVIRRISADMTREESTEDVVRMLRAFTASIAAGLCIFAGFVWWQADNIAWAAISAADTIASVIAAAVLWATGG